MSSFKSRSFSTHTRGGYKSKAALEHQRVVDTTTSGAKGNVRNEVASDTTLEQVEYRVKANTFMRKYNKVNSDSGVNTTAGSTTPVKPTTENMTGSTNVINNVATDGKEGVVTKVVNTILKVIE